MLRTIPLHLVLLVLPYSLNPLNSRLKEICRQILGLRYLCKTYIKSPAKLLDFSKNVPCSTRVDVSASCIPLNSVSSEWPRYSQSWLQFLDPQSIQLVLAEVLAIRRVKRPVGEQKVKMQEQVEEMPSLREVKLQYISDSQKSVITHRSCLV